MTLESTRARLKRTTAAKARVEADLATARRKLLKMHLAHQPSQPAQRVRTLWTDLVSETVEKKRQAEEQARLALSSATMREVLAVHRTHARSQQAHGYGQGVNATAGAEAATVKATAEAGAAVQAKATDKEAMAAETQSAKEVEAATVNATKEAAAPRAPAGAAAAAGVEAPVPSLWGSTVEGASRGAFAGVAVGIFLPFAWPAEAAVGALVGGVVGGLQGATPQHSHPAYKGQGVD